jgi:hypothetical protein
MDTVIEPPGGEQSGRETWILLMDPGWSPEEDDETPPLEAVVGLWPVTEGTVGKFRPNPDYVPADENSPSDPLDAALRLVLRGRAGSDQIQLMLRDSAFDIAMNGDGRPLITKSPDDLPCVVVATGEQHRRRVTSPQWRRIDLDELVVMLADGVDVLINPAGPASVRLTGDFMRETSMLTEVEVAELHARHRESSGMHVVSPDQVSE